MRNRIWVFVVAFIAIGLLSTDRLSAQSITTTANNHSWLNMNSFYGIENRDEFSFYINNLENLGSQGASDWSVYVKLDESRPIKGKDGQEMGLMPNKIKLRFSQFVGGALSQISNYSEYVPLLSGNFIPVINPGLLSLNKNNAPSGNQFLLKFDIKIEEGCYLSNFAGSYTLGLVFEVRYIYNGVAKTSTSRASTQLSVNIPYGAKCPFPDTPGPDPVIDFAFEVNANATLNFNTPEDYTKQVENNPNSSWLKVTSKNTPYIVRVKTNSFDFTGDKETIPVNAVSMKVDGPANSASGATVQAVTLSPYEQVVFNGKATGTNSHLLDVRYFITKNEAEKLATKQPGQYTTTLTYTLSPP